MMEPSPETFLRATERRLGVSLQTRGELRLLSRPKRRCFLLSRGERVPHPNAGWFPALLEGVLRSLQAGETLVVGLDRIPWETALRLYVKRGGPAAVVVLDRPLDAPLVRERGAFLPPSVLLISAEATAPRTAAQRRAALLRRDLLLAELADRAWRLRVRRDGHTARAEEILRQRGARIEELCFPDGRTAAKRSAAAEKIVWEDFRPYPPAEKNNWLLHYTRAPNGPWPGEPRPEYIDWLIGALAPRTDLDTLVRILAERRLRASGRLVRGRVPVVSFTAAEPRELAGVVSWRRGLGRWNFRPYGVAVRRDILRERCEARPVRYLSPEKMDALPPAEQVFAQPREWAAEKEWRVRGDVRLSELPAEAWRPVVFKAEDLELLPAEDAARACRGAPAGDNK